MFVFVSIVSWSETKQKSIKTVGTFQQFSWLIKCQKWKKKIFFILFHGTLFHNARKKDRSVQWSTTKIVDAQLHADSDTMLRTFLSRTVFDFFFLNIEFYGFWKYGNYFNVNIVRYSQPFFNPSAWIESRVQYVLIIWT